MSFLSRHTVVCDKCNIQYPELLPMNELLIKLDQEGWGRGTLWNSEIHICPKCPRDVRALWWDCIAPVGSKTTKYIPEKYNG